MVFRRTIPFAFASVTTVFLVATGISQTWALSIDPPAREIAADAAPSIRHAAAAATELRHIQALVTAASASQPDPARLAAIGEARRALDHELSAYLGISPARDRERSLATRVRQDLTSLDASVDEVLARAGEVPPDVLRELEEASDRTSDDLERTIELHASVVGEDAERIQALRDRTVGLLVALDGFGVLVTIGAAVVVWRGADQYARLQEANAALLREQVAELEAFSGRVAHDVLGPLGGVSLGLELVGRAPGVEPRALERARACVAAVDRVVRDLLEFARSGARPTPGGRAEVRAVVAQVLADAQADAEAAAIELRAELADAVPAAACTEGVLLSLVSNLVRNAVKYMGPGSPREVLVRARGDGDRLRVEVRDTGSGMSDELVRVAFQPHVRGRDSGAPGLGLGLATVRRLAEAHGGRVGVVSAPGAGSTFWFELPAAL